MHKIIILKLILSITMYSLLIYVIGLLSGYFINKPKLEVYEHYYVTTEQLLDSINNEWNYVDAFNTDNQCYWANKIDSLNK